jgi:hypothetical protein
MADRAFAPDIFVDGDAIAFNKSMEGYGSVADTV